MSGPQTELFHGLFSEATRIVVTPTVWQYDGDDPRALIIRARRIQLRAFERGWELLEQTEPAPGAWRNQFPWWRSQDGRFQV